MLDRVFARDRARLSRSVSIGRTQPGPADLHWLRRHGFRAVLDLRENADHADQLPPDQEAEAAEARGLVYAHFPVPPTPVDDDTLDRFGVVLKRLPKPVFVHCTSGRRAGMFALTQVALEQGMPGPAVLEMAGHLDVLYGTPALQASFADYVERRAARPDPLDHRGDVLREQPPPAPMLTDAERQTGGRMGRQRPAVRSAAPRPAERRPALPHGSHGAQRLVLRSAAVAVGGAVAGMVLDRRLLVLPLVTSCFLLLYLLPARQAD